MSDYPSYADLEKISNWPGLDGKGLLEFVKTIWWNADTLVEFDENKDHRQARYPGARYQWTLHTGGWPGNEDIIDAMMENFVWWSQHFYSQHRGGHWTFDETREN